MEQKKIQIMVSALLILLFLAACSTPPTLPTQPQSTTAPINLTETAFAPTATLEGNTPVVEQGLCTNTY